MSTLGERIAALPGGQLQPGRPTGERIPYAGHQPSGGDLAPEYEADIIRAVSSCWREGDRHALALGLAGWLKDKGASEAQATRIIEGCAQGDEELPDRLRAVRTTYAQDRTAGWSKLRELLPGAAAAVLEDVGTAHWEASRPPAARIVRRGAKQAAVAERPWPTLGQDAWYGLLGEIVAAIEPHTEADPAAMLATGLVMFGSAVGRNPHALVGAAEHRANEFLVLVGGTNEGRKGTAYREVLRPFRIADRDWATDRTVGGLSSGEGLVHAVRDAVEREGEDGKTIVVDPGVTDKRLFVIEPEFASPLKVASREGNTLSERLRQAWDGDPLQTMTRKDPMRATGAHISIVGHITPDELRRTLDETSQTNGYANRFLFVCCRRSKLLPDGGALRGEDVARLGVKLGKALAAARKRGALKRTSEAGKLWSALYPELMADRPGLLGAMTARGAPHVLRLSLLYALLDEADSIDVPHVRAALALWDCCEDSARYVFGDATGDPVADRVLSILRATPDGATQNELGETFGKNLLAGALGRALETLTAGGLAVAEKRQTGGRSATVWHASPNGKNGINGKSRDLSRISRLSRRGERAPGPSPATLPGANGHAGEGIAALVGEEGLL